VAAIVDFDLSIYPNTQAMRDAVTLQLQDLFIAEAGPRGNKVDPSPQGKILLTHIIDAIQTSGLQDHSIDVIEVDDGSAPIADIEFTGFQYPVLGEINFSELT
jgi:hypothetical protein